MKKSENRKINGHPAMKEISKDTKADPNDELSNFTPNHHHLKHDIVGERVKLSSTESVTTLALCDPPAQREGGIKDSGNPPSFGLQLMRHSRAYSAGSGNTFFFFQVRCFTKEVGKAHPTSSCHLPLW